jgi:hypothetical protein
MNDIIRKHAANARRHDATHNDGGEGFNPHLAKHDAAVDQAVKARIAEIAARFPEVRAAWNAAVAKYTINGKLRTQDIAKIEAEVGVTQNEIRLAKAAVGA